jgi:hypothetical protein
MTQQVYTFCYLSCWTLLRFFTPFNAQWSHNVAIFTVDCCYGILQQLLHIWMPSKASVTFQAIHHPTSLTRRNIVRYLTYKQKCLVRRFDKAVVFWVESLGQSAPEGMLSHSQELRVMWKGTMSSDIEITYVFFWEKITEIFPG